MIMGFQGSPHSALNEALGLLFRCSPTLGVHDAKTSMCIHLEPPKRFCFQRPGVFSARNPFRNSRRPSCKTSSPGTRQSSRSLSQRPHASHSGFPAKGERQVAKRRGLHQELIEMLVVPRFRDKICKKCRLNGQVPIFRHLNKQQTERVVMPASQMRVYGFSHGVCAHAGPVPLVGLINLNAHSVLSMREG